MKKMIKKHTLSQAAVGREESQLLQPQRERQAAYAASHFFAPTCFGSKNYTQTIGA